MNCADNPISDLAECIAHAQYEGFSVINYETRDYEAIRSAKTAEEKAAALDATKPAQRRPTTRDFEVYAMFTQTWGSTALGHGGIGGAAVTDAYTVVLHCKATGEYLVYFGSVYCYTVRDDSPNFSLFIDDCRNHYLKSKRDSVKYFITA